MTSSRARFVLGNWKMHPATQADACTLAQGCLDALMALGSAPPLKVGVCPTLVHLAAVGEVIARQQVALLAQDVAATSGMGACTGEVSAQQLADVGAMGVLVGHSERRQHQHESAATLKAKVGAALGAGLLVVFCVGEQWPERQAGQAGAVVLDQLAVLLDAVMADQWPQVMVAYEPVWAIGTGQVAAPADAQAMHALIRQALTAHSPVAALVPILYGGSVKPDNAAALAGCPDVDGALVGGASLDAAAFAAIVAAFGAQQATVG